MSGPAQVFVFGVAIATFGTVLWLVRRGSLKERFALLWLTVAAGLFALALIRPLLDAFSDRLEIEGTTTLFVAAILFLMGLVLHLSVIVSRLEGQVRDIAESHALLEKDLQDSD